MSRRLLDQPKPKASARTKANTNRWRLLNEFVDVHMAGLTRAEVAVWMVLYRDSRNGVSKSGMTDISRRAGVSTRHGMRAVRSLMNKGLLLRTYRGGLNRGVSRYVISTDGGVK